jgi:hypothetical protein
VNDLWHRLIVEIRQGTCGLISYGDPPRAVEGLHFGAICNEEKHPVVRKTRSILIYLENIVTLSNYRQRFALSRPRPHAMRRTTSRFGLPDKVSVLLTIFRKRCFRVSLSDWTDGPTRDFAGGTSTMTRFAYPYGSERYGRRSPKA